MGILRTRSFNRLLSFLVVGFATLAKAQDFNWDSLTPSDQLQWTACYPGFQCTRFNVPLAYSDPNGEQVSIALIRLPSSLDPSDANYRGPILFNPGGPGISGVDQLLGLGAIFHAAIGSEFDWVSFDPRGVGRTTPTFDSVFASRQEAIVRQEKLTITVDKNGPSLGTLFGDVQVLSSLTASRANNLAQHVSTAEVARDMLRIITAYGYDKLQFWGISYGTILGSTFASMFPDNVGTMVLDGVVDPDNYYSRQFNNGLVDADLALTTYYQDCVDAGPQVCPIHEPTVAQIRDRVNGVLNRIKAMPIPFVNPSNNKEGVVGYDIVKTLLYGTTYAPHFSGASFAAGFALLEAGFSEPFWTASSGGTFEELLENTCAAGATTTLLDGYLGLVIGCGEAQPLSSPVTIETLRGYVENLEQVTSFADVWTGQISCAGWSVEAADRFQGTIGGNTSHPILFIGNTADPITPLRNAQALSLRFPGSVVLQQNAPGHTTLAAESVCTAGTIRNYFLTGSLPAAGTVCEVDSSTFGSAAASEASSLRARQTNELFSSISKLLKKRVLF